MEDEYAGQGGSYLIDPKTGKRKLVRQTLPAEQPDPLTLEETSDAKKD